MLSSKTVRSFGLNFDCGNLVQTERVSSFERANMKSVNEREREREREREIGTQKSTQKLVGGGIILTKTREH